MLQIIYIGLGGFFGAISRFLLTKFINNYFPAFPFGTLIVNVTGSFILGVIFYSSVNGKNLSPELRDFIAIGFIGAYTTMSAFALDSYRLAEVSEYFYLALNIFGNIFLCLLAVYIGKELAVFINR